MRNISKMFQIEILVTLMQVIFKVNLNIPIEKIIVATNENDILDRFFRIWKIL